MGEDEAARGKEEVQALLKQYEDKVVESSRRRRKRT